jgi:hypothetical protein
LAESGTSFTALVSYLAKERKGVSSQFCKACSEI